MNCYISKKNKKRHFHTNKKLGLCDLSATLNLILKKLFENTKNLLIKIN